jgi:hypothetical protein
VDSPRAWSTADTEALVGLTGLTRLALGGGAALLRPLLERLADAGGYLGLPEGADGGQDGTVGRWVGRGAPASAREWLDQRLLAVDAPSAGAGGASSPTLRNSSGGGSCGGSRSYQGSRLQLRELEVGFDVAQGPNELLLPALARLTTLTMLKVGGGRPGALLGYGLKAEGGPLGMWWAAVGAGTQEPHEGRLARSQLWFHTDLLSSPCVAISLTIASATFLPPTPTPQISWPSHSAYRGSFVHHSPLRQLSALSALTTLRNLRELNAGWPVGEFACIHP